MSRALSVLAVLMVSGGAAWITFISLFSASVQSMAPDWVRARVLAVFMLTFQGGLAAGSALWGLVAERAGVQSCSCVLVSGCVALAAFSYFGDCPRHRRTSVPGITGGCRRSSKTWTLTSRWAGAREVEYIVDSRQASAFVHAIHDYEHIRRREARRGGAISRHGAAGSIRRNVPGQLVGGASPTTCAGDSGGSRARGARAQARNRRTTDPPFDRRATSVGDRKL